MFNIQNKVTRISGILLFQKERVKENIEETFWATS